MESAKIDGAGEFSIFVHIVIPQIRPAMGSLAIFTFLEVWNDMHLSDLSATLAASVLTMIPVTVVFLIFQKQFVKGIAMTGMK